MTAVHGGRFPCARSPSLLSEGSTFSLSLPVMAPLVLSLCLISHLGKGKALQVISDMYYGFTSSIPACLSSSEQCGFHHKQAIPNSFILVGAFLCSFLLHIIKNFRNKNKKVSGLVCCEVSTSPFLCWITEGYLAGFLLQ